MRDSARAGKLKKLFHRSASFLTVEPGHDPCASDAVLEQSLFFSKVRGLGYHVETHIGSGPDLTALVLFVTGHPIDGQIPNVLIQFSTDGTLKALVETLLNSTKIPGRFNPVEARPLAPHDGDVFEEILAEKVADAVIDDLLTHSIERGPGQKPSYLR